MNDERPWLPYVPNGAELCPSCHTCADLIPLERETEAEYSRAMDPALSDQRPSLPVRTRYHALKAALWRRRECPEGHGND